MTMTARDPWSGLARRIESWLAASRPAVFGVLWLLLAVQTVWTALELGYRHVPVGDLMYPVVFVPASAVLAVARGRFRFWWSAVPRLLIAVAFLDNVCDRLGMLGPPGAPGVAWGDFAHFVVYTAKVNAFAPASVVPALAVLATIAEGGLGILMLLGLRVRLAAAGSALLLLLFAAAMVASGLSQLEYAVALMAVAAWAMSTFDASALTVDALVARMRRGAFRPESGGQTAC